MPNSSDTKNTNALQPGQKAYIVVRSDGERIGLVGYDSMISGDWFIVSLADQRSANVFRPISTVELTPEQYAEEAGK